MSYLGIEYERYKKYQTAMENESLFSSQQIRLFFDYLNNRLEALSIASLDDLYVRFDETHADYSEKQNIAKEVVGTFHLSSLLLLIDVMKKQANYLKRISRYDKEIERIINERNSLSICSPEYQESLDNEIELIKSKKAYLNNLTRMFSVKDKN